MLNGFKGTPTIEFDSDETVSQVAYVATITQRRLLLASRKFSIYGSPASTRV